MQVLSAGGHGDGRSAPLFRAWACLPGPELTPQSRATQPPCFLRAPARSPLAASTSCSDLTQPFPGVLVQRCPFRSGPSGQPGSPLGPDAAGSMRACGSDGFMQDRELVFAVFLPRHCASHPTRPSTLPLLESTQDSERFRDGSKDAQPVSAEPGWEPGSARVKATPAAPDALRPAEALTWWTGWQGSEG